MESFRTFKDAPAAKDLAEWLRQHGIPAEVRDTSAYFDPSFAHSILSREWAVHIPSEDFTRAAEALQHFYEQRLDRVPSDYYLFAFTDKELEEILMKPDEWGDLDYALAHHMLRERGKGMTDDELSALRHMRYLELSMPETAETGNFIGWGYCLAILGGFIGSMIGWYLMNSQKTLPDGKKVPRYPDAARMQGRRIFWLGIVVTVAFALLRMYLAYERGIAGM